MPKKKKKKSKPPNLIRLYYGPYLQSGKVLHNFQRLKKLAGFIESLGIIVEREELEAPQSYARLCKALNAKMDEDEKTGETRLLSPEEQLSEHGIEREYEVLWEIWDIRELTYDGDGTHYDDAVNAIRNSYELWDEEEAT